MGQNMTLELEWSYLDQGAKTKADPLARRYAQNPHRSVVTQNGAWLA